VHRAPPKQGARQVHAEGWLTFLRPSRIGLPPWPDGEGRPVLALSGRIVSDRRHHRVFELYREPVPTCDFGAWTMAFEKLTDFKPEFLRDRSSARMLVGLFLEKERTLTMGACRCGTLVVEAVREPRGAELGCHETASAGCHV
jgi:hypothetical protein